MVKEVFKDMKEKIVVEFTKDKNYVEELDKYIKEGWSVVSGKPIEKIIVEIVGKRFELERENQ
jgi:hypothetical protein